jgi:hypothetical protein
VSKLVYIATVAPDEGESVNGLLQNAPSDALLPPISAAQGRILSLDKAKFAADVDDTAAFMADSQVPRGVDALGTTVTEPAWYRKPILVHGHQQRQDCTAGTRRHGRAGWGDG